MKWRTDKPPFDDTPHRQFVLVEGVKYHSGVKWLRLHADTAYIRREDQPDQLLGYREEDILRIMRDGDMDEAERVLGWLPATFPSFAQFTHEEQSA